MKGNKIFSKWNKEANEVYQYLLQSCKSPTCPFCGFDPEGFIKELNEATKDRLGHPTMDGQEQDTK